MPFLSVIIPTHRVGGLDVTFAGLERQTFRDFELVLSDHLHLYRSEVVEKKAKKCGFPVKHVRPYNDLFPLQSYQRCMNTGVLHASGEIGYFTCDYAFLPPDTLEQHASFHRESKQKRVLIGTFDLRETDPLKSNFPVGSYGAGTVEKHRQLWEDFPMRTAAGIRWADKYASDLSAGTLYPFMWSTFEEEWAPGDDASHLNIIHTEPKATMPPGPCDPMMSHLKNDSIPLDKIVAMNGFDEDFDGAHGFQDTELSTRLLHTGTQFHLRPSLRVNILDMHHHMTIRKVARNESSNRNLYYQKHASGSLVYTNHGFSLRKMREELAQKTGN